MISVILSVWGASCACAAEGGAAPEQGKSQWLIIARPRLEWRWLPPLRYAQSRALAAACEGVSRNPGATDIIRLFLILGLAFIEFLALLTFVVILMLQ